MTENNKQEKSRSFSSYWFVPFLLLSMDLLCVYAWLIALVYWFQEGLVLSPLNFFSYLILSLTVYAVTSLLLAGRWPILWVRLVTLSLAIFLLLVLVRLNLSGGYSWTDSNWFVYISSLPYGLGLSMASGIYLVWKALSLERSTLEFNSVYRHFTIGLILLILVLVFWGFSGQTSSAVLTNFGLISSGFFGLGILTLALVNLENLQKELSLHNESVISFRRRWLITLVFLVVAILAVAIGFIGLFNTNLMLVITQTLKIVFSWVLDHVIYLLYPFALITQVLFWVLRYIVDLFMRNNPPEPPKFNQDIFQQPPDQSGTTPPGYFQVIIMILKWLVLIAVIGIALVVLWRSLRRNLNRKNEEELEEENESLWSWQLFKKDLRNFWGWLFGWLRIGREKPDLSHYLETPAVNDNSTEDDQYDVRELYRALLWQGRELNLPRNQDETPNEYRIRLKTAVEEASREIDELTEAYVNLRYGRNNPGPEKLKWLNSLWRSLRGKIKQKQIT